MKTNTIAIARELAARVEMSPGFMLDVGMKADYVEVRGKGYNCFIRTYSKNKLVNTRVFKTRAEQCEYLRDLIPTGE